MDCIFCKIIQGEIKSDKVFEDDEIIAIRDIHPKAPTHILFISKKHRASLDSCEPEDAEMLGRLMIRISEIARQQAIAKNGYKVVMNCGKHGGQIIDHIHFHLLGGRPIEGAV